MGGAAVTRGERYRRTLVAALRRKGAIRTDRIRHAFLEVPREVFVPEVVADRGLRAVYTDEAVPTKTDAHGMALSSCSQPGIVAAMLELLDVQPGHRILEIGAGTGYNAALLRVLVGPRGRVVTLDVDPEAAVRARRAIRAAGFRARVVAVDGRRGWEQGAPYDRIIATASSDHVPPPWFDQLADGGTLVMPLRLTEAVPFRQIVVALVKNGAALRSRAVVPGGFMRLRDPGDDVSLPWPQISALEEVQGRRTPVAALSGATLGALSEGARRRLLRAALEDPTTLPLGLRVGSEEQYGFEVFMALAAPFPRLVGFVRPGLEELVKISTSLPAIMQEDGLGFASVAGRSAIDRIEEYGRGDSARVLAALAEEWKRLGRPDVDRLAVYAAFDRHGAPDAWRSFHRSGCALSFSWLRSGNRPPGAASGTVATRPSR